MISSLAPVAATVLAAAPPASTSTGEAILFWIIAPIAVLASLGMLVTSRAVHSALLLALTMMCLAFAYIAQDAPFLGIVQIVVYTGAVMMLFLFVLMIVGVDSSDSLIETIKGQRVTAVLFGVGFAVLLVGALGRATVAPARGLVEPTNAAGGNVPGLAQLIFTRYVFAFEVTSALLITAALGAMVLTHRELLTPRLTQRELSERRFRSDRPTMLPAPGVYARHNAVDTPALLPDGSPLLDSVPTALELRDPALRPQPAALEPVQHSDAPASTAGGST